MSDSHENPPPTPDDPSTPDMEGAGAKPESAEEEPQAKTRDLTDLLTEWEFEPGKLNVRLIRGVDGSPKVQVRLDLGILQMETDGRPDGARPEGFESLLEYHETRIEDAAHALGADEDPDASPAMLDSEACRLLREEAMQYYHRYIALLVLEDFSGVVRDTSRNMRVADLVAEHAEDDNDRQSFEAHRPYIMMMRARALASQALADQHPKAAIWAIDQGLAAVRRWHEPRGGAEAFESSDEAEALRQMRAALVPKLPVSQKAELRERLQEALMSENYELAAILRDELRLLGESKLSKVDPASPATPDPRKKKPDK